MNVNMQVNDSDAKRGSTQGPEYLSVQEEQDSSNQSERDNDP
jgi:hypothetical protein